MTELAVAETPTYYSISAAAKRLKIGYNRIIYALSQEWVVPYQREPIVLIEEFELFRYANANEIPIPEE